MHLRPYVHLGDDAAVQRLLVEAYPSGAEQYPSWLPPRWEYMHAHSLIDEVDLTRFGVAEGDDGRLLGIVHNEHHPAFAYLQRRPGDDHVLAPLLDWAEAHLGGWSATFDREVLGLYVPTGDGALTAALARRGYVRHLEHAEPTTSLAGIDRLPPVTAPAGTRLQTLAEHTDLAQVHRVLWRGFDHEGPPPPDGVEERRRMQATPGFRPELTLVTVTPEGTYTAFCGVWLVPEHRLAYVEPVATDPDHRRRGHGRAVVLEALRRAGQAGAEVAWVGSDQPFYLALGFQPRFDAPLWVRG
ncbi:MAG: GNAT family N-acetyltransferase [Nitriliruptoraceae bacterium]